MNNCLFAFKRVKWLNKLKIFRALKSRLSAKFGEQF